MRVLEPEIENSDRSQAYVTTDFSAPNQFFVDESPKDYSDARRNVIDIDCGPCDTMLRLAKARQNLMVPWSEARRLAKTIAVIYSWT